MQAFADSPQWARALPLRARTDYLCRRFAVRPRKSLGQNFLVNEGAAQRLAAAAGEPGWPLLEIGGGLGALTLPLAETGLPLTVVEIDARLAEVLGWLTSDLPLVRIVQGDALALEAGELPAGPAVAVGNLPYLSAGALLQRLWAAESPFAQIVATVQREVAERLRAVPGTKTYGPLSVLCQAHVSATHVLAQLGGGSFQPAPQVESTALLLTRRQTPPPGLEPPEVLDLALRAAFGARRKTLTASLRTVYRVDRAAAAGLLAAAGIAGGRRGETLALEELLALGQALYGKVTTFDAHRKSRHRDARLRQGQSDSGGA